MWIFRKQSSRTCKNSKQSTLQNEKHCIYSMIKKSNKGRLLHGTQSSSHVRRLLTWMDIASSYLLLVFAACELRTFEPFLDSHEPFLNATTAIFAAFCPRCPWLHFANWGMLTVCLLIGPFTPPLLTSILQASLFSPRVFLAFSDPALFALHGFRTGAATKLRL